ncbi:hypothetical protein P691DRAFT_806336 [Macrolepiota fuliginosa MF-IS2]|uniref:Uncharacterized protein n=1 Tax=Macrolepiota fuliginosa MF-IS2 TaxID=1400762 RepID=A0A9P5X7C8_9AGAR|nr:hypothetical protein P691DRAFT_806336 [Macrolepiota fuliginosa MF-IS2]
MPPRQATNFPGGDFSPQSPHGYNEFRDVLSDPSGVMVYSPLLPSQDSHIELADSEEVVEEGEVDEAIEEPEVTPEHPTSRWSWSNALPSTLSSWFSRTPHAPSPSGRNADGQRFNPQTPQRRSDGQAMRIWIPSKDQLSIQCTWWGYRLFLPPPIIDILDDKQLETAKRAAMITAALTWFFDNLPISSLPPVLQPALFLLQRISPYPGCIGTLISWSWIAIKNYDKGFGVTLSATWILPIALIPGTWHERDWPSSPPPPELTPLPPDIVLLQSPPVSLLLANEPTSQSTSTPDWSTALPPSLLTTPTASPAVSFVTAPSSPIHSPPIQTRSNILNPTNLVANLPLGNLREFWMPARPMSLQEQMVRLSLSPAAAYPSPTNTDQSLSVPASASTSMDVFVSDSTSTTTSAFLQEPTTMITEDMQPSDPVDPNDINFLKGPKWKCSPLPPEDL